VTQREDDIAQLEAKMRAEKLFKEWRDGYMGPRGRDGEDAEGVPSADAEDFNIPDEIAY
jgi:hypothetical protein